MEKTVKKSITLHQGNFQVNLRIAEKRIVVATETPETVTP